MKKIICMLILTVGIGILCSCGADDVTDQVTNIVQAEDEHIISIKNAIPNEYPGTTYGEAFDAFFASPTWKYFISTDDVDIDGDGVVDYNEGIDVVEFTGYCTYQDVEVKAKIQFILNEEEGTFQATYLSFNDVPQNKLMLAGLLQTVFTNNIDTNNIGTNNSDAIVIPEGLYYDEVQIENIAGYYQDLEFKSSLSCNMYSSPEGDIVGNVTIYLESACMVRDGELIKIRDNVYKVNTTDEEMFIGFYMYDNFVNAILYIDGEYVQEFVIQTEYVS